MPTSWEVTLGGTKQGDKHPESQDFKCAAAAHNVGLSRQTPKIRHCDFCKQLYICIHVLYSIYMAETALDGF